MGRLWPRRRGRTWGEERLRGWKSLEWWFAGLGCLFALGIEWLLEAPAKSACAAWKV